MKIKLFKNMVANGKPYKAGDTVEVNDRDARYFIVKGHGEEVKAAAKPKPKPKAKPKAAE